MENKIKVLEKKQNFFSQSIWIEAMGDCCKFFHSFLGEKKMYLEKGEIIEIKISKKTYFKVHEEYDFNEVCNCQTGNQFYWTWS